MAVTVTHATQATGSDDPSSQISVTQWNEGHEIDGLATVAETGAYSDLSGKPTLGTAAAADTTDFATAAQGAKADTAVQPAGLSGYATTAAVAAGYQPLDSDLTTWAGVASSANGRSLVSAADYAVMRALLDLEAGTDFYSKTAADAAFQPLDPELSAFAGLASANGKFPYFTGSGTAALADNFRMLAASAVSASHTGNTNETTLATVTIPAGAMGANGALRINSLWSYTNSGNTKTLRNRLDGISGTVFMSAAPTTTASAHDAGRIIQNRNSVSSQVCRASGAASGPAATAVITGAKDTSGALDLVFTAQLANSGETITLEAYSVEIMYKA